MQDGEHAHAGLGLAARHAQHGVLVRQVEGGRGLVEKQVAVGGRVGVELGERARKVDALLLAARERRVAAPGEVRHAGGRHGAPGGGEVRGAARPPGRPPEQHHVEHVEAEGQRRGLGQHGAPLGERPRRRRGERRAVETDRARRRGELAGEQPQRGRLAGAVRTHDRHHLARRDAEREPVDERRRTDADRGGVEREH